MKKDQTEYDKPFKTYDEMIDLLKSRNVVFQNKEVAKEEIANNSYYSIVNGYKTVFNSDENGCFNPPIYFEELLAIYDFYMSLNSIILKYILRIEKTLKSKISYLISEKYGVFTNLNDLYYDIPNDYLNKNNYQNTSRTDNLLKRIKKNADDSNNASVQHYKKYHNHIPCWILINAISFGLTIQWFSILKQEDKSRIVNDILKNDSISLESKKNFFKIGLEILRDFRNSIAHGNKAFANSINKKLSKNQIITFSEGIINSNNYIKKSEENDVLNVIIILGSVLPDNQKLCFYRELFLLLDEVDGADFSGRNTIYTLLKLPNDLKVHLRRYLNY